MATEGPNLPANGSNDNSSGTLAWSNPGNIVADDWLFATVVFTGGTQASQYLVGLNYGFDEIPDDATIDGFTVRIGDAAHGTGTQPPQIFGVRLYKAGVAVGTAKSPAQAITTTQTDYDYGGPTDKFGTTWTPAEVKASTFGAGVQLARIAGSGSLTALVDYIEITVHYTEAASGIAIPVVMRHRRMMGMS